MRLETSYTCLRGSPRVPMMPGEGREREKNLVCVQLGWFRRLVPEAWSFAGISDKMAKPTSGPAKVSTWSPRAWGKCDQQSTSLNNIHMAFTRGACWGRSTPKVPSERHAAVCQMGSHRIRPCFQYR